MDLNYTNPAAIVAEATTRVFPYDKKLINMCDMPCIIMESYADMLGCELWDLLYLSILVLTTMVGLLSILHRNGEDLTQKIKDCILTKVFRQRRTLLLMNHHGKKPLKICKPC